MIALLMLIQREMVAQGRVVLLYGMIDYHPKDLLLDLKVGKKDFVHLQLSFW